MQRVARKVLSLPPTILIVITITFLMLRLTPGDPATIILGEYATEEAAAALRVKLGLDQPMIVQYVKYIAAFVTGDFGRSLTTERPVLQELANVLPYTVSLAIASTIIAVIIGIPLGVLAALNRNTWLDHLLMTISLIGVSTPIFVLGFVLLLLFSYQWRLFPLIGVGQAGNIISQLHHLALPSLTLGLFSAALIASVTRSSMLDVLGREYIRTARGKGLPRNTIIWRHAFRNTLISVVSLIGMQLATLLGGTVITELVFSRQGIGQLLVNAILSRDYPLVQGIIAIFLTMVIIVNLVVDLLYISLDPRIE